MVTKTLAKFAVIACLAAGLAGCATLGMDSYTPIAFENDGRYIYAYGDIDSRVIERFLTAYHNNPEAEVLVLEMIGGSLDDEVNLQFSAMVRDMGLKTHVPTYGLIASGGTDLFLAGTERTLENGACVGVHAWATDDYEATDIPRDDPVHDEYLDYMNRMGIDEEFYWFTLAAAPADEMHWMNVDEVNRFALTTQALESLGNQDVCDNRP